MDVTTILGWQLLVGGLLTVYYVSKIAIVTFAHYDVNLTKHLPLITIVHGVLVIILYNLFAA